MNAELPAGLEAGARRAYEGGMLRLGLVRAALVTAAVGLLVAVGVTQLPSPAWLGLVFAVWLLVGWRGDLLWRGALGGLVVGLGALALPMSILRSCCNPEAMANGMTCASPQVCVAAGTVLGAVVAASLPRSHSVAGSFRASAGALIGVVSLVACRCTTLFVGESLGLLAGLLASAAGLAVARSWWEGRTAR